MWSGTSFTNFSGNVFGVHQKVDRIALRTLKSATNTKNFPTRKLLLHFEGKNGPDGIKAKSPAQNEPWHYIDPFDPDDTGLVVMIDEHYKELVQELKNSNMERAAFEASWLAHAMVDGMTPAHHFPYEEALIDMRKGEGIETRTTLKEKLVMKGDTVPEKMKNNWLMWGFKGVMISHGAFEFGVAAISGPLLFRQVAITPELLQKVKRVGVTEYYLQVVREIALWNMYEEFTRYGWTWSLSKQVRDDLLPKIIETVAVTWYLAMQDAGLASRLKK